MTTTPTEWLTIDDAAARMGCSTRTLQRRVASGSMRSQHRDDGRTLVEVEVQRPAPVMADEIIGQLQRQADDSNRIAALAAVASEQTAIAYRDRIEVMASALADSRANAGHWRMVALLGLSVTMSGLVMAGILWGRGAATERQLSDTAARLQASEDGAKGLAADLAAMTEARHLSDAEAARLRDQVEALQSMLLVGTDDCPTAVAAGHSAHP